MKTALQEIFEYWNTQNNPLVILNWIASNEKRLLEKEKEQMQDLINALEDIKNWDDDLEVEWGDCGERAIDALKIFNQNNKHNMEAETTSTLVYKKNDGTEIFRVSGEYEELSNDDKLKLLSALNDWAHNEAIKIFKQIK
jgi:hypothetical protein